MFLPLDPSGEHHDQVSGKRSPWPRGFVGHDRAPSRPGVTMGPRHTYPRFMSMCLPGLSVWVRLAPLNAAPSQLGFVTVTLCVTPRNEKVGACRQSTLELESQSSVSTEPPARVEPLRSQLLHSARPCITGLLTVPPWNASCAGACRADLHRRVKQRGHPLPSTNYPRPESNRASSTRFSSLVWPISGGVFECRVSCLHNRF
jgi:hypothetical protein